MEATETGLLEFFKQTLQIIIPNPDRSYRWTEKECQQLWYDVLRVATDESISTHFIGTIIYVEYGILKRTPVPRLILIDGQQRLITVSLLMAALTGMDSKTGQVNIKHKEINDLFLFNDGERGEFRCKLLPVQGDRETFLAIINNEDLPALNNSLLAKNYRYFRNRIEDCSVDTDLIYKGIAGLTIMDVSVDRAYENPQSVCEMLDATGLDESQNRLIYKWLGLLRSAS
ncbi:MAG TPA: DUF262 domain-containing protein [Dehalococcoidia bacterium]|nr:DUF262 domain-containing protein [Dehalococcoidia bacterium]